MALGVFLSAPPARAQALQWTTNFYAVTGTTFREIRHSIAASRPWQDSFDGDTRWTVSWRFSLRQGAGGCSPLGVTTETKITTTLPRWTPPTNATPELKQQWTRYFTNLAMHEAGHARIAIAAAAEVRQRLGELGPQPDCEGMKRVINERGDKVVDDYRAREREYDRVTNHGRDADERPDRPGRRF
jgi:predicted secreted Zn-dependent protease